MTTRRIVLAAATAAVAALAAGRVTTARRPAPDALVTAIVDGDTVHLAGYPHAVRLIGIDAPEATTTRYGHSQCGGDQATSHLAELIAGHVVHIELDRQRVDRYGRTLAYLWLDTTSVNTQMIADGYAYAVAYPPNTAHQQTFTDAETVARTAGAGLWTSCPTQHAGTR